jgi:DNA-binding CsgD family transcriptional regulator
MLDDVPIRRVRCTVIALPLPSSLHGRERERAVLREHRDAAMAGHGSLVLIGGEAGIGKTALAEALCREAAEQGTIVLVGRCYDLTETPPYGPWVELFDACRPLAGIPPLPAAFAQRGTVGEVPSQAALVEQVRDFLTALAAQRPVLLLLDDFHWADPASLDLLRILARAIGRLPILALVTYRLDELTRHHPLYALLPLLERESGASRLDLGRLSPQTVHALVAARYSLPTADAARLANYLHARAEGNVFFTLQLLRALEEGDALSPEQGGWMVGDLDRVQLPLALRQVIDGRLARLGEAAQRLLGVAAVIGQETPLALWGTVAERDEEALLGLVEQAAHVLVETPDGVGVRFEHALVREAVYEGLSPSRRRLLHRRIGETLAAAHSPDPDTVAYHFQQASDARAVAWFVKAGERAHRSYAWLTAALRYEAALAILEREGAPIAERGWLRYRLTWLRWAVDPMENVHTLDEVLRLAEQAGDRALAAIARHQRGHYRALARRETARGLTEEAAGAAAVAALTPAEQARLLPELRAEYLDPPDLRFYEWTLTGNLAFVGRFRDALTIGERAMALTPPITGGVGYWGMAMTYAMLGRSHEAGRTFAQARAYYQTIGDHLQAGWVVYYELLQDRLAYRTEHVTERRRLADEGEEAGQQVGGVSADMPPRWPRLPLLLIEGEWAEARSLAQAARSITVAAQREVAVSVLGLLDLWEGEEDAAWTQVREMFPDGPNTAPGSMSFYEALVLQRVGAALALEAGNFAEAYAWLVAHTRYLDWSGAVLCRAEGHLGWAAYYRTVGDRERAEAEAAEALALAGEPRQPLALIAAHRLCGELDTTAGRHAPAAVHLATALTLAEACAAPHERALTLLAFADLHATQGKRTEVEACIAEARAICTPLGALPALRHADALTQRLDATTAVRPTYPAGLTAREVEVLRLVAAGKTNREIADRFFLSLPTVNNHVAHILTKTNTANRAEAAAFAQRHGLT